MPGNTFGHLFRVTTFGESHGGALGCVIDGCPPGIELSEKDIQPDLDRRKPGQSRITTQRKEEDKVKILSGVFGGKTLGSPICMIVHNKDANPKDYEYFKDKYRPSHADFTYEKKYGLRGWTGGGRASARETVARVAAGAVAKKILRCLTDIEVLAFVSQIHTVKLVNCDFEKISHEKIESNIVRCPDAKVAKKMIRLIEKMQKEGESVGGVITCVVRNVPVGLGEPVFDKLDAEVAKALLSIQATKGFEIGSGFKCVEMKGSEHNDPFYRREDGSIGTITNHSGGVQGGISNGENIVMRVAFKPTPTIMKDQRSVNNRGKEIVFQNITGRHDPCPVPRAVPIVEGMVALVLVDHYLRHKAQCEGDGRNT